MLGFDDFLLCLSRIEVTGPAGEKVLCKLLCNGEEVGIASGRRRLLVHGDIFFITLPQTGQYDCGSSGEVCRENRYGRRWR